MKGRRKGYREGGRDEGKKGDELKGGMNRGRGEEKGDIVREREQIDERVE